MAASPIPLQVPVQPNPQIIGPSLESLIRPYVHCLTFGIDIGAGIIIGISAVVALISFFKILRKSPKEQTQDRDYKVTFGKGNATCIGF